MVFDPRQESYQEHCSLVIACFTGVHLKELERIVGLLVTLMVHAATRWTIRQGSWIVTFSVAFNLKLSTSSHAYNLLGLLKRESEKLTNFFDKSSILWICFSLFQICQPMYCSAGSWNWEKEVHEEFFIVFCFPSCKHSIFPSCYNC